MSTREQPPLLILGYNRPDMLDNLLRTLQPYDRIILISVDGDPENSKWAEEVKQCQSISSNFSNSRDLGMTKLRFTNSNLGCRFGVSSAIDWAFKFAEELIIIEDDLQVTSEFINFCDLALRQFEFSKNIYHINGYTPLLDKQTLPHTYLTKYVHVWGWATWKSRWVKYDLNMEGWPLQRLKKLPSLRGSELPVGFEAFWGMVFDWCKQGGDTWDLQWVYTIWSNGGLAVSPGERLVGNLGFDERSTHTFTTGLSGRDLMPRQSINTSAWTSFGYSIVPKVEIVHEFVEAELPRDLSNYREIVTILKWRFHHFNYVFREILRRAKHNLLKIGGRLFLI